jgi:hypothetical protein
MLPAETDGRQNLFFLRSHDGGRLFSFVVIAQEVEYAVG